MVRHARSCPSCCSSLPPSSDDETPSDQENVPPQTNFDHTADRAVAQPPFSNWWVNEHYFQSKCGVNRKQFNTLYRYNLESLQVYQQRQLGLPNTVLILSQHNLLTMFLYWLRLYQTKDVIAGDFNITDSRCEDILHDLVPIIHSSIYKRLVPPLPRPLLSSSHPNLPNVTFVIDSTFVNIPKPMNVIDIRRFYHPKAAKHSALKVQITNDFSNMIVHVSDVYPGSVSDVIILRGSSLFQHITETSRAMGDMGYQGIDNLVVPYGRRTLIWRDPTLNSWCKHFNRELHKIRSTVENLNQRVKLWNIVGGEYRGDKENFTFITLIVQIVCAIANLNLQSSPLRCTD